MLGMVAKTWPGHVYDRRLRRLASAVLPLFCAGDSVVCPCCDGHFRRFIRRYGSDALCPRCLSLKRHRLLWLYLRDRSEVRSGDISLLHISPEEALERRLRALPRVQYVSADLNPSSIEIMRADITNMPFAEGTFDIVICNHVLEHVPDDRKAMGELHRVLKPGGHAYMMHPVSTSQERTDEDPTVTDKAERRRRFGQDDHVRRYGRDFIQRNEEAGFEVTVEEYSRTLSDDAVAKYVLGNDRIYVCRKSTTS
jgi:SAM-dependent methyltransferase